MKNGFKKSLLWLDDNIEKIVILIAYSTMAGIVCVEVVRRFLFNEQVSWSTSIPVLLFLWVTWFGAAYNVKLRTHLRMSEVRERFSLGLQYACVCLDTILWLVFAAIVIYFSTSQTYLSFTNFALVAGTDDVMQWWFYLATPLAWSLLIYRVLQCFYEDTQAFLKGQPFKKAASLMQ